MTTERPLPYIGISGVNNLKHNTNPENTSMQYWLMDQFVWAGLDDESHQNQRQLLLGVKAVHKTQYLDVENKYGREWYPVGADEFESSLDSGGIEALRTAQIYFDADHVADADYRNEFIKRICSRGYKWLNALQFDLLPWHDNDTLLPFLEEVKQTTGHTIILQAHGESMQKLTPDGTIRKLGRYAQFLDYVLFDASHGKGLKLDTHSLLPFLDAAYGSTELANVGFGVAGGLSADIVQDELPKLLEKHGDISWDAEGRLHKQCEDGTYEFDWAAAKQYLQASDAILRNSTREV